MKQDGLLLAKSVCLHEAVIGTSGSLKMGYAYESGTCTCTLQDAAMSEKKQKCVMLDRCTDKQGQQNLSEN